MGRLGWLAAFVYCGCAALRLARFNTNLGRVDKRYFQGLPSPAAAGLVAGFVWAMEAYDIRGLAGVDQGGLAWVAWVLALIAGFTMVSNIQFYSGKEINLRKAVPFKVVVLIAFSVVIVVQMADNLPELLFSVFFLYVSLNHG